MKIAGTERTVFPYLSRIRLFTTLFLLLSLVFLCSYKGKKVVVTGVLARNSDPERYRNSITTVPVLPGTDRSSPHSPDHRHRPVFFIPAPSSTALSGCPSRLPPASPFCGREQALLLLRVFVGVTRRPGPGPKSPHGAPTQLPTPRMQPGKPVRDRRRGKEPDFLYKFKKVYKIWCI